MKKIIFLTIVLCVLSCKKLVDWDKFQLQKTEYTGSQLRTDGYYYELLSDGSFSSLCCFYRNGILLDMGGAFNNFKVMDEYVQRTFINSNHYSLMRASWGLFVLKNNCIQFERYYPNSSFVTKSFIRDGIVLSDTSFHITVSYRSDGSEIRTKDEYYYFRKFSPKPDSTNIFF